jgi:release factor glutamine methyltransferase
LDIGTGSGNIAISLTKYIKQSKILALDISDEALDTARRNARAAGAQGSIVFVRSDIFGGIRKGRYFHAVVSNPPYVNLEDMESLPDNVKSEPRLALYGGVDGLDFYRRIIDQAPDYMVDGGFVFFEIGYDQADRVKGLMAAKGYRDIEIFRDYSGIERIVRAKWTHWS